MAELGNNRRVYIVTGTAQSPTYTVLAGEQTNNFNRTAEAIETSDKSAVWAQFISGKKGATAEVTVYTNDADAQQKAALNGLHTGATVKVFIGTLSTAATPAPTQGDLFEALVTAISDTNDNGAVASRSLSLTATGAVTHTPAIS
jgi:predicted secreted protein